MNKMLTAIAIGQLVEAGKVAWDDPLSKHLGEDWRSRSPPAPREALTAASR